MYSIAVNLKVDCFSNVSEIYITSVLSVSFVPGVNLHLTESSVTRIEKYLQRLLKMIAVPNSTTNESMIGDNPRATRRGKGLTELYYSEISSGMTTSTSSGRICHPPKKLDI